MRFSPRRREERRTAQLSGNSRRKRSCPFPPSQQLFDAPKTFIEQMRYVFIVERVIGDLALLSETHEPHLPERSQTVRDGRLRDAEQVSQVADARLFARERKGDLDARRIAQQLEGLGERRRRLILLHYTLNTFHFAFVIGS